MFTSGGLCGGVLLDEEFIKLIKGKVTNAAWYNMSKTDRWKFLNDEWEHAIKPQFRGQNKNWLVELPESCQIPGTSRNKGFKRRKTLDLPL